MIILVVLKFGTNTLGPSYTEIGYNEYLTLTDRLFCVKNSYDVHVLLVVSRIPMYNLHNYFLCIAIAINLSCQQKT